MDQARGPPFEAMRLPSKFSRTVSLPTRTQGMAQSCLTNTIQTSPNHVLANARRQRRSPLIGSSSGELRSCLLAINTSCHMSKIKRMDTDASNCEHWGLSVWLTEEAAEHGRRLMPHMRKWHVAKGHIAESEGVFLNTPSNHQEEHYTFWKCFDTSVTNKFAIALYPLPEERS